jgi:hypothetical protein
MRYATLVLGLLVIFIGFVVMTNHSQTVFNEIEFLIVILSGILITGFSGVCISVRASR